MDLTHAENAPPDVSQKTFYIAGIVTTVYGLDELPPSTSEVACLWLLHPRLQNQQTMKPAGAQSIHRWNSLIKEGKAGKNPKGLIAVSFDQRNHGTRLVDKQHNEAWRSGNPRHAQDMYTCYQGTAQDAAHLLTHLTSYIFVRPSDPKITDNFVLGVSLGAHAAWHSIIHDPRVTAAVIIIGCPDYTRLMIHRAEKSKLASWTSTSPPGTAFLGSADFPQALIDDIRARDPMGYFFSSIDRPDVASRTSIPSNQVAAIAQLLDRHLHGKRIQILSGGSDKLVPYECAKPFLDYFKGAVGPKGWARHTGVYVEDLVFKGVGHEFTAGMAEEAARFVMESMMAAEERGEGKVRDVKI
ncbi:hypothetical protein P152DRAFT_394832 [Eremomyces bilateralis CBS 781.70]|uniref:Alpha/beta-hydrolase n=1 Tax=Eremomyces bilateralis CBS 781.70 TaxID=1392243 RepID=A0A6G1G5U5_9PEZI|nr:uncharacterized protein P152DRAFT_394832 [Eremomyces bilateralis CBS 781.70]KAF1813398.1 hypothetical protein P152DRAFT_394832 [Eremomyces bilateralis CBS 781.70]